MLVRKYSASVKLVAMDREAVIFKLKEIAFQIKRENREVEKIILFGSLANGEPHGYSDVDILIIVSESAENIILRSISFRKYFDLEIPVDLIVYTKDEVNLFLKNENSFVYDILNNGLIL